MAKAKEFKPKFYQSNVVVMNCDNQERFGTDEIEKVRLPDSSVMVFLDYAQPIGLAKLSFDEEGKRVLADIYLDALPPRGHFPALQGEPSDFWEGDRVLAVGEGEEENVMVCEVPEDKQSFFTSLVFTGVQPTDIRIEPFELDACLDLSEAEVHMTD